MEAYIEDLEDMNPEAVENACIKLRKTSEFFPSIATIRKEATPPVDTYAHMDWQPHNLIESGEIDTERTERAREHIKAICDEIGRMP